ncbi:hypothetical protein RJ55_04530 [Drechmeria coniospora]|nr:hypothetical protein RJ55_04530 [Drechmeria coniospora]
MSTEPKETPAEAPAASVEVTTAAATGAASETARSKLTARLADIIKQAGHGEMWGVELSSSAEHAPSQVVLQKFLRANGNDAAAAEKQLVAALEWRKQVNPTALVKQTFDGNKFGGLGYVTVHPAEGKETVITWNIYGSVKDNKATFGDVQEFIRWRAALMELGVQKLRLNEIKEPLADDVTAEDPHQMLQVHDYRSVSFFRMDPAVKAASKETIQTFSTAYPELLAHKYFVNVPAIMGWMFGAMKFFLAPATLRKFHPMTSGTTLAVELKTLVDSLPKEYGGEGKSVTEGETVALTQGEAVKTTGEVQAESAEAPAAAQKTTPPAAGTVEVAAAKSEDEAKAADTAVGKEDETTTATTTAAAADKATAA